MIRRLIASGLILSFIVVANLFAEEEQVRAIRAELVTSGITAHTENQWVSAGTSYRSGQYAQELDADLDGSIYHSNFLSFDLAARLGLMHLEDSEIPLDILSPVVTADIHLLTTWLKQKPLYFTLYIDHGEDVQDVDMFENSQIQETAAGGMMQWNNRLVPVSVAVRTGTTTEVRENYSSASRETGATAGISRSSLDGSSRAQLNYTFSDFDRVITELSTQSGMSHEVRVSHDLGFGGEGGHSVASDLSFMHLRGTTDSTVVNMSERLALDLRHGFGADLYYGLYSTGARSLESTTHRGSIGADHQLYESLTSSVRLSGRRTSAPDFIAWNAGPLADLVYRKNIGIGYLNVRYSIGAEYSSLAASDTPLQILDERHILSSGTVTFLGLTGVDAASIAVTDGTGSTVYLQGIDYELASIGAFTQLIRLSGGSIGDGEEVLVDYVATGGSPFDLLSLSQRAETRVTFFEDSLAVFLRYSRERLMGEAEGDLAELDRVTTGIIADFDQVYLGAEYENAASSQNPYDALRFQQHVSLGVGKGSVLSVQGSESVIRFRQEDISQRQVDLEAGYRTSIGMYGEANVGGGIRFQGEESETFSTMWEAAAGVSFQRGLIKASMDYEIQADQRKDLLHTLRLMVRKEF